ncbi:14 kDa phosphohistidine phosphatase-like [Diabrotica virgifera virgifera]|uniref:Sex-regulated protein janus-A n=1 Tax=Diabrotica virgifera virgifera TaxID=50390 RepID=A0A6P7FMY4_DIAVI|nr:14 kDa phosphohistidine phosphatase-like [Diabrotica virgifera virgifera]XP_050497909.1 14 kDa phosphohistidine phosphatase-like [Diabrotica virgifera virgifera]
MASAVIPQVKDVDIDASGVFKYILIKLSSAASDGKLVDKLIVRGYAECPFHADINDQVTSDLQKLKSSKVIQDWRTKVLGGGRIQHDPEDKKILVYGYSQGYGKADHQLTVDILKTAYPDYSITYSDEGY